MTILFVIFFILVFSADFNGAEHTKSYRLKIQMYESILDALLNSTNLDEFDLNLNQVSIKRTSKEFSTDEESFFIETVFPGNERIITAYSYPSCKVIRVIFLHKTNIYSYIESYLNKNAIFSERNNIWHNSKKTLLFSYKADRSVAILNICNADLTGKRPLKTKASKNPIRV